MCGCCRYCLRRISQFFLECCQIDDKTQQSAIHYNSRYGTGQNLSIETADSTGPKLNSFVNRTLTLDDLDDTATTADERNDSTLHNEHEIADFNNVHLTIHSEDSFDNSEVDVQTGDEDQDGQVYTALCYYQARVPEDLGFAKSEQFIVLSKKNGDWWYVRSLKTQEEGYIPSNFIAPIGSPEAIEWYYGDISRVEAENRLKVHVFPEGTFLVRQAQNQNNQAVYSLSVLEKNCVRHYRIYKLDTGCVTINKQSVFLTLDELIRHHQNDADGLKCVLTKPFQEMSITAPGLSKDAWEIDRGTLLFTKKIGSGQFADVWLGSWNDSTEVAIKKLKNNSMSTEDFLKEAYNMKKLRHKNLVQLFAICSVDEPILIITEFLCHGSLKDYLVKSLRGEVEINIYHQIDMMSQISSGMAYLEAQNYVHRDLAARNILVGENNVYKVADFGLSRLLHDNGYYRANQNAKLPIKWLAIESALRRIFTIKSDVWAYGILMYEIMTKGKEPYPGMSNKEVVNELERKYRMDQPRECPLELYAIMTQCWEKNETKRPSFDSLYTKFQYLASLDNLEEKFMMK